MFPVGDNIASSRFAAVTWAIIAANVAVFFHELSLSDYELEVLLVKYALIPRRYFSPSWAAETGLSPLDVTPFLTNTFLHGGLLHIVLNLWTLYIFGPALEERLGSVRFALLYLASGIIASLTHALFNPLSAIPALGASGAIAGVISAYAFSFPHALVRVLVPIFIFPFFFNIPALVFAGIWFLTQVLSGTSALFMPGHGGGIAWWAHIGGFVAGWVLLKRLDRGRTMIGRPPFGNASPWLPFRWFR